MTQVFRERIPHERVGVLIGESGKVKRRLEKLGNVRLSVNSASGDVELSLPEGVKDVSQVFLVKSVITAIGRGFSPEKACRLFDEETLFESWDLREDADMTLNDVKRVQGRIIGREGKMRRTIEELTGASVSVYGTTVSILGISPGFEAAREAIQMLIDGRQHSTVYKYLSEERRKIRKVELSLWEEKEKVNG